MCYADHSQNKTRPQPQPQLPSMCHFVSLSLSIYLARYICPRRRLNMPNLWVRSQHSLYAYLDSFAVLLFIYMCLLSFSFSTYFCRAVAPMRSSIVAPVFGQLEAGMGLVAARGERTEPGTVLLSCRTVWTQRPHRRYRWMWCVLDSMRLARPQWPARSSCSCIRSTLIESFEPFSLFQLFFCLCVAVYVCTRATQSMLAA